MNFQKLFGPLTRSREDRFFDDIIGNEHIKRLFGLALRSQGSTPKRCTCISQDNVPFVVATTSEEFVFYRCGNTTKAGIIDHLFKNRAPIF